MGERKSPRSARREPVSSSLPAPTGDRGPGGGGSGGTIYIETVAGATLGTDAMTASSGAGVTVGAGVSSAK